MNFPFKDCTCVNGGSIMQDLLPIDGFRRPSASDRKLDELHTHMKVEESILGSLSFPFKIPKDEDLLLEDEVILKEESEDHVGELIPHQAEEIVVKDEYILQPSSAIIRGISKINNSYLCDVCQYQSMDVMKLKTHIVLHIKEKPFKCVECDYEISTKFDLTLHILNEHSQIFRCTQCKYTTIVSQEIEQHMVKHSLEQEEHMKILAAEKPFKCRHCEYRAAKEYFLKKHNMLKHSPENCFKCKECSFSSLLKSKLQKHMETHKKRKKAD